MSACVYSVNVSKEPGRVTGARTGAAGEGNDHGVRRQGEMFAAVATPRTTVSCLHTYTVCTFHLYMFILCFFLSVSATFVTQGDEIWQDGRPGWVADHFGELWSRG